MENNTPKLKIILLGNSGVGKTSIINQYVFKKFQHKGTLDFPQVTPKHLEIEGKNAILQILDTNGQERHGGRGLEAAFFNDAKGCMLVYDVNDPTSFDNLENWHNEFITRVISYQSDWKSFPFILLGNKTDVDGGKNKELSERARKWCQNKGQIHHLLTSAKENKNINESFQYIAKIALKKEETNSMHTPQLDHSNFNDEFKYTTDLESEKKTSISPPKQQNHVRYSNGEENKPSSFDTSKVQRGDFQNVYISYPQGNLIQNPKKGSNCKCM